MIPIEPIRQENNVPLLFAVNPYYLPYTAVMLQSIMDHAEKTNFYDVIILHTQLSQVQVEKLLGMVEGVENFSIRLVDVSEKVADYTLYTEIDGGRLTGEAYYRLLVGEILSERYERAIYLDGDMVALVDVAQLLDEKLDGCYLAAPLDICGIAECYKKDSSRRSYRQRVLGIKDMDTYFISGLLVFDLVALRRDHPGETLMKLAGSRNWLQHDQDVLNFICRNGRAKLLPPVWNVLQDYGANHLLPEHLLALQRKGEREPFIIHYGGDGKPWKRDVPRESFFWKTAVKTPYFETILRRMAEERGRTFPEERIVAVGEKLRAGQLPPCRSKILKELQGVHEPLYEELAYRPLISVIVCVYNVVEFFHRAAESLLGQTYQNLEIIFVDDGSTDGSGGLCDDYAARDPRVKVLHKKRNSGHGSARNTGLAAATGEWIGWLDPDDWIEPDFFTAMAAKLQECDTDLVTCGRVEECDDYCLVKSRGFDECWTTEEALGHLVENTDVCSYVWDKLYRRELFQDIYFPEDALLEDFRVMHHIFARAKQVAYLADGKYHYCQRADSLVGEWDLAKELELLCAKEERFYAIRERWPQISQRLLADYANGVRSVWGGCSQLSGEELRACRDALKQVSAFCRREKTNLLKYAGLGKVGRTQVWLCRYPHRWSFALCKGLEKLWGRLHPM